MKRIARTLAVIYLALFYLAGCATTRTPYIPDATEEALQPPKVEVESSETQEQAQIAQEPAVPGQVQVVVPPAPPVHKKKAGSPFSAIQKANQEALQQPSNFVLAMAKYDYSPYSVYRIYCAPERVTDIQLAPGEYITGLVAGDTVRWLVSNADGTQIFDANGQRVPVTQAHVFIKPIATDLQTNLIISTNVRAYNIDLTSTSKCYQSTVSWKYPEDEKPKAKPEKPAPVIPLDLAKLNANYEISDGRKFWKRSGKIGWQPSRVFDDGAKTYIQFPPELHSTEAPALFVVSPEGETQLVNYRVAGSYYIVDRLFDEARLVVGQKNPQVVNIKKGR
jgi:P-type conjugative transfer protein TrbG